MTIDNQQKTVKYDENKIVSQRRSKLKALRERGIAFPNDFRPIHRADSIRNQYNNYTEEALKVASLKVTIAGRMILKRIMGKVSFATLQDASGCKANGHIQLYITSKNLDGATYDNFKHYDLGDILGVEGTLFKTKTGELSINVAFLRLLTKSLRPLPDKFNGLADQEIKYRKRFIDLIINENTRCSFKMRTVATSSIRLFMEQNDFMEVETPMLHNIPGGASAKPFVTHHNTLDMQMFLRISPELYLKRLLVGGFERVFEIGRSFRNEGISVRHNPEFTMMEFYAAYVDYKWLMVFTENIIRHAVISTHGTANFIYQGRELDLSKPFERLKIIDAIKKYMPKYQYEQLQDSEFIKSELKQLGSNFKPDSSIGSLQLALFEETTEAQLWNPTYIVDYPVEVSPLARASDNNPNITERFELFITGHEIANGFSELNDPEDQAKRFQEQVSAKSAGDEEAMYFDADYVCALEHGMPPAAGCGIGIDRLMMLITNSPNIRDVILFPHLRYQE